MSARIAFGVFGLAAMVAVAAGCVAAGVSGTTIGVWGRNLAAWAVGGIAAAALCRSSTRVPGQFVFAAALCLALIGLAASLAFPGLSGVHRWIALGPVRLNAAELLAPMAVVACAGLGFSRATLVAVAAMGLILAAQPDRSQAVAFAGAVVVMLQTSDLPMRTRLFGSVTPLAAAALALLRPDPLQPVAEVEGILSLALRVSPLLAPVALLALLTASIAPLAAARPQSSVRPAALGLCAYLVLSAAAAFVAPFPVPLVGMGVSPILGAWLGIGLLLRAPRPSAP